jgi:hypothetical protein
MPITHRPLPVLLAVLLTGSSVVATAACIEYGDRAG